MANRRVPGARQPTATKLVAENVRTSTSRRWERSQRSFSGGLLYLSTIPCRAYGVRFNTKHYCCLRGTAVCVSILVCCIIFSHTTAGSLCLKQYRPRSRKVTTKKHIAYSSTAVPLFPHPSSGCNATAVRVCFPWKKQQESDSTRLGPQCRRTAVFRPNTQKNSDSQNRPDNSHVLASLDESIFALNHYGSLHQHAVTPTRQLTPHSPTALALELLDLHQVDLWQLRCDARLHPASKLVFLVTSSAPPARKSSTTMTCQNLIS